MHNLWIFRKHFLLNMDKNNKKIGQLRFFCKNKILEQNQDRKKKNEKDKSSVKNIVRYMHDINYKQNLVTLETSK